MATKGSGTTGRGREMELVLGRWRRSGVSLREFARENGLSANTLAWWRWKLKREDGGGQPVELVELKREWVAAPHTEAPVHFEVVFGNGLVVRVPEMFEESALERVVRTLGRC